MSTARAGTSPARTAQTAATRDTTGGPNRDVSAKTAKKPLLATRLALSPVEAAAALGVSVDHLDEHISHELRWVRRGRRKFVSVRELERWLDESAERTL